MIRATFVAVALFASALPVAAQNPTPAPPPSPPAKKAQPAPRVRTPRPPQLPLLIPSDELGDWSFELPELPEAPDAPDVWRLSPMPDVDFELIGPDIAPAFEHAMDAWRDVEFAMPMIPDVLDMPDFPDMPDIPDMPDMPDVPDVPDVPDMPVDVDIAPMVIEPVAPVPPVPAVPDVAPMLAPMVAVTPMPDAVAYPNVGWRSSFERQFSGISSNPPESFAQADPADSLYRLARTALNRGEYRRAAELFGEISQKFPNSAYASDARYWRAFSLYRLGGHDDLRTALVALQDTGRGFRQAQLQTDAPVLAARIRGALARDGDEDARKALTQTASQTSACDREDLAVRIEALNSLGQTDPESTTPILRRVLARRDDCSATLRRAALYLLGRRTDDEARDLVMSAARNDPDIRVRADALRFLAAMPGDQSIATIEEMARTPGNDELQRAAVAALGRSDAPRARQSLRNIIERTDLSENLRVTALASVDADHVTDNGAYIRSIYPRLDTPRLKAAAMRSLARIGGNDNDQFLLSIARNQNESSDVRVAALRSLARSTIPIGDLVRMYDIAGDRRMREQLISFYSRRDEPEATDKLLEIARNGTDPDMRRYAIAALSRKNDPRTKKLLLEIIDK